MAGKKVNYIAFSFKTFSMKYYILIFAPGDGLGKNNDGICKPLKAAYKFNKSGLGHNQADDMNNHWWENVFNAAAGNMQVNHDEEGGVSMERKTDEAVEVCYSIKNVVP